MHGQVRYHDEAEHLRSLFRDSVRARLHTTYPVSSGLSVGDSTRRPFVEKAHVEEFSLLAHRPAT